MQRVAKNASLTPNDALWLRGGQIIDPANDMNMPGDVLIADGIIQAIGNPGEVAAYARAMEESGRIPQAFDLPEGHIIAPGFVDLHVHLREPGLEIRETVQSGAHAAVQGGYTTICCMPNTQPILDNRGVVEWVRALAADAPARVLPIAAITQGQAGTALTEQHELADAGVVAFSDDGKPVKSAAMLRLALTYGLTHDRPIINHCEDPDLVGKGVMHAGPIATQLGLRGWPATGETLMLARDLELAAMTGGRYHAAHLSIGDSVALVRHAKERGLRVTAEVTPHHLLLSHAWVAGDHEGMLANSAGSPYDTTTKVNPPLRTLADAERLLGGLIDGTIDAIATDHAPHSAVEKDCTYDEAAFGIAGLETALGSLLTLVHADRLPMRRLIEALTIGPARAFGLEAGTLSPGSRADVVVFDPYTTWTVEPQTFASQGHNTPLAGTELRGQVQMTITAGKVVYQRDING
jgi:dihydroorotase